MNEAYNIYNEEIMLEDISEYVYNKDRPLRTWEEFYVEVFGEEVFNNYSKEYGNPMPISKNIFCSEGTLNALTNKLWDSWYYFNLGRSRYWEYGKTHQRRKYKRDLSRYKTSIEWNTFSAPEIDNSVPDNHILLFKEKRK